MAAITKGAAKNALVAKLNKPMAEITDAILSQHFTAQLNATTGEDDYTEIASVDNGATASGLIPKNALKVAGSSGGVDLAKFVAAYGTKVLDSTNMYAFVNALKAAFKNGNVKNGKRLKAVTQRAMVDGVLSDLVKDGVTMKQPIYQFETPFGVLSMKGSLKANEDANYANYEKIEASIVEGQTASSEFEAYIGTPYLIDGRVWCSFEF